MLYFLKPASSIESTIPNGAHMCISYSCISFGHLIGEFK
jgi:hypothetical protein